MFISTTLRGGASQLSALMFGLLLVTMAAVALVLSPVVALAERPHAATILAPPPPVPIPPQGEVPTGNPSKLPAPRPGTGEYFIGHRFYGEKEAGWGWIKGANEKWSDARWCCLKEKPGVIVAPYRTLPNRWDDHNHEYKLWGYWADYTAYDPYRDKNWPVFVLKGYESLGPQEKLKLKPSTGRNSAPGSRGSSSR